MLLHYVCREQLFREHIGCLGPASYMLWVFIRDGSLSRYLSPVPSFGTLQNLYANGTTPLATNSSLLSRAVVLDLGLRLFDFLCDHFILYS